MAHYAKLDENNMVLAVEVIDDANCLDSEGNESEEVGRQYLEDIHGWVKWKKTSYNTNAGKYYDPVTRELASDQSKAFRANHACIGLYYSDTHDIFHGTCPHASWTLNTTTGLWDPPVATPEVHTYTEGEITKHYVKFWNEGTRTWRANKEDNETDVYEWNPDTSSWNLI